MGNQVFTAPTQLYSVEYYFTDLPNYEFIQKMGSTRFLKVARAKYKGGYVVVKVFPRIDNTLLQTYYEQLNAINTSLTGCPGTLAFPKAIITDRGGILIRQYIWSNLYDRINTRPFLVQIDKLWIVYQLLRALFQCHSNGICHGDLKTENVLLTSWNWVLLTDFACYKPADLLEDNPASFSFFFDTSRRRTCYIAPERFTKAVKDQPPDLKPSMDIFSLGCTIAELYLEGNQLFDLHLLMSYKNGHYNPSDRLEDIENKAIVDLIKSMISLNPDERKTCFNYLNWEEYKNIFPNYFPFLYDVIKVLRSPVFNCSDKKMSFLYQNINMILEHINDSEAPGYVIITSTVTSCIRGLQKNISKIQALEILEKLSIHSSDDIVVDRILPHILYFATDTDVNVRTHCLTSLTACLQCVSSLPANDANIFPEYIFPIINKLAADEEKLVQRVFAENIGTIAQSALYFLELNPPANFDAEVQILHNLVQSPVQQLLTGEDSVARRILLEKGITPLCVFFGQQKANDYILSHMITFLNNKNDWRLRAAFFDCVVGVAAFVGWHSLNMLKPLLQQGLSDTEEFVVSKTLSALISLSDLGLLEQRLMEELVLETAPFLCHPNLWIRFRAVGFISSSCKQIHIADVYCKLLPELHKVLELPVRSPHDERCLFQGLADPLPRAVLELLSLSPLFYKIIDYLHKKFSSGNDVPPDDIKSTLDKLRHLGMGAKQELQILSLQDYISKVHLSKQSLAEEDQFEDIVDGAILIDEDEVHTHYYLSTTPPAKASPVIKKSLDISDVTLDVTTPDIASDPLFSSLSDTLDLNSLSEAPKENVLQGLLNKKQAEYTRQIRSTKVRPSKPAGWVPKGTLVCHIQEHKAAINKVKVSPNYNLLATASDDGCVKIWNCRKIDSRNIINHSRHTYSRQNQPVRAMAFYDAGDRVAAITRNGSLHEVGVQELKVCAARSIELEDDDVVIDMDTLDAGSDQLLIVSTALGKVMGIDVRAPSPVFNLSNKPSLGSVSAMCVDPNQQWVSLGTRSGWVTCWDLRFRLAIQTFQHPTECPIISLCPKPQTSQAMSSIYVGVEGYNEVGVWNLETVSEQNAKPDKVLWSGHEPPFTKSKGSLAGVYAMLPMSPDVLVTGGADQCVRIWDLQNISGCRTVSAPEELQNNHLYKKRDIEGCEVIQAEQVPPSFPWHEEGPRRGPTKPPTSHHHTISDISFTKTTQPFLVTVDMGGVMKIWK